MQQPDSPDSVSVLVACLLNKTSEVKQVEYVIYGRELCLIEKPFSSELLARESMHLHSFELISSLSGVNTVGRAHGKDFF